MINNKFYYGLPFDSMVSKINHLLPRDNRSTNNDIFLESSSIVSIVCLFLFFLKGYGANSLRCYQSCLMAYFAHLVVIPKRFPKFLDFDL